MEQKQLVEIVFNTVSALFNAEDVIELRIPKLAGYGTVSGYFDDLHKLAESAADWDAEGNIYITLNPVNPALMARANNRVKRRATDTTADAEIPRRRFILIDADPQRPKGLSATEAEHEASFEVSNRAYVIRYFFSHEVTFSE